MQKQTVHDGWTLQAVGELAHIPRAIRGKEIPATVPGCVHTDLLAAGLIPEPYYGLNELKMAWIGRTDWRYACVFTVDAALLDHERVDLVCEGLDTVARVELNGQLLGETATMHHPHRFDAKARLRPGRNELAITFKSPLAYAEQMRDKLGDLPHTEKHPFNFIRKMACNFGWDWGPAFVTAGIWQPLYLHAWNGARIRSVRPLVLAADAAIAQVEVLVDIERAHAGDLAVSAVLAENTGRTVSAAAALGGNDTAARMALGVAQPQRWWPRGHGEQPLYGLTVRLAAGQSELEGWTGRIGLRTATLNTDKDEIGSKFVIEVNGKAIFCKGANWIPDDCFPTRVDEARYRRRLEQAVAANMNMLRVWGGGIFET
ncbi:MAG: glycoside hydrolase family 2 protein, partial [Planctomycetota bacterium]|nr:glycoside hydrolase family 2 protein [Planctomycetota bacterium]